MEREGIYEIHCNRIIASSISTLRLNPTYCSAAFLDSDLLLPSPNSSIAIVVLNTAVAQYHGHADHRHSSHRPLSLRR